MSIRSRFLMASSRRLSVARCPSLTWSIPWSIFPITPNRTRKTDVRLRPAAISVVTRVNGSLWTITIEDCGRMSDILPPSAPRPESRVQVFDLPSQFPLHPGEVLPVLVPLVAALALVLLELLDVGLHLHHRGVVLQLVPRAQPGEEGGDHRPRARHDHRDHRDERPSGEVGRHQFSPPARHLPASTTWRSSATCLSRLAIFAFCSSRSLWQFSTSFCIRAIVRAWLSECRA